ncbi:hypothetical protein L873DRAFT_941851 [Choiromyces venosus 120613-1]|uniref:HTH CENPB-type domain-containing protein n=1 Tax=Choiromyces venosus 120613-1 TaxID=1336337 RepID=A0A3N4K6S8_9PEZI|nr:hypothetical protein L873DRAFT_941851 [Choiromyces venosus 120613-1]
MSVKPYSTEPMMPYEDHMLLAIEQYYEEYKLSSNSQSQYLTPSICAIMEAYSVACSTLGHRLHGYSSQQEAAQRRLKMTPGEEEAIEEWCLTVASWCMPLQVKMLHNMSEQLLQV